MPVKSTAMQVNCTVLPGQREGSGETSNDTLDVSNKDLWAPVQKNTWTFQSTPLLEVVSNLIHNNKKSGWRSVINYLILTVVALEPQSLATFVGMPVMSKFHGDRERVKKVCKDH